MTLTEQAVQRLHHDILSGKLPPGVKLGITHLVDTYEIGATPIREALSRLVSQNLIVASGRRGFFVRELSEADLIDITNTRLLIECEGIRLSMELGGDDWETDVLAQMHRLRLFVERHGSSFGEQHEDLDRLHRQFHASLLAGCGSPRIIQLADNLYSQAFRYRRILMGTWSDPDHYIANHKELADAVLARDLEHATTLNRTHLFSTLRRVYQNET
ncbi:GntR family transcriptional regulator [Salipiger sp. 1_MG-2023]|uniref:GntR family transcriptional regulator n=1 Tax=Salipiger sp. 1_MG-2023 TaxID=3062665 RepID=UPI0026E3143F|nr:FCD domain-containing protein [Salipiger sp. 1_MG-2023]